MHIVIAAPSVPFPADKDGMSVILANLLTTLRQRHQLTLLCFGSDADPAVEQVRTQGITVRAFPAPRRSLLGYYAWPFRTQPWFAYRWNAETMQRALHAAAQDRSVDLIVLHSPFFAQYLAALHGKPTVLQVIDAMSAWLRDVAAGERNPLRRFHLRQEARKAARMERRLLPLARKVIVASSQDKTVLEKRSLRTRVTAIANGVDTQHFWPRGTASQNQILFTGRMDYPPNIQAVQWFAKHVWPSIRRERPDVRWHIAGRHPVPAVRALGADAAITVTGEVPDIPSCLQQACVVIAPMQVSAGVKNKVLEACACGKPIVATPQAVAGLDLQEDEHVLIARDASIFAKHVLTLLSDTALRTRIGTAARQYAERHAWDTVAKVYEQVYEEAVHL